MNDYKLANLAAQAAERRLSINKTLSNENEETELIKLQKRLEQ